jgi:DNA-binding response OmpR family regulator
LPDGSGLKLLTEWRGTNFNTNVIILSARHEVDDKITGLNLGADDYITKPFNFGELLARLRSVVHRQVNQKKTVLEHRNLRLYLLTREVTHAGTPVQLTQHEFALQEFFLKNPARVLTRTQIAEKIWDWTVEVWDEGQGVPTDSAKFLNDSRKSRRVQNLEAEPDLVWPFAKAW